MPKPAHVHIVIGGKLFGGEIFATGFDLAGAAADQAELNTLVDNVANILGGVTAPAITFQRLLANGESIESVKGYSYAAAATAAALVAENLTHVAGAGGNPMPNQVALVATLRTAVPSRRTRGRMYLPANGSTVTAVGQLNVPAPSDVAEMVATLINVSSATHAPVVVSGAGNVATPITSVSVDTRFDVQRRRANREAATAEASSALP
jgi:hypothetical protein